MHSKNASSLDLLIHAPLERSEPNNDAPPRVDVPVKQLRHRARVGRTDRDEETQLFRLTLLIAQNVQRKLEWNSLIGTESIEFATAT